MEVYRLFIAIEIENQDCKNTLKEIQDLLPDISLKLVSVENLHLTLKFLGDTEKSLIPEIIKNLTTIKIIPFTINFTSTGAFPNRKHPRVLWIGLLKGMHTLNELSVKIDDMMNLLGFPSNSKAFNPHVTVARTKKPFPNAIKLFNDFYSYFSINSDCPFSLVTKFFLKKSTLTPKGPIYEDLHVFV